MNALIIVDIQNDFLPGGPLAVPQGEAVITIVNRLQERYDVVVATQDWHPPHHGSFAANHPVRRPGELIDLFGLDQILWPVHCVQSTSGADFAAALDRSRWDGIFPKGTDPTLDSYSGFFDNGHRQSTGLGEYLQGKGVTAVDVVGLATDYCVKCTALDARQLGFRSRLIKDACRGVELQPGDVERAIMEMRDAGVEIVSSAHLPKFIGDQS